MSTFNKYAHSFCISSMSYQKLEPFGIKNNIDLEATNVKVKIYIYMAHFYLI